MRKIKKVLCVIMSVITILSIPMTVSAKETSEQYNTVTLENTSQRRVVETRDENSVYTTIYDIQANTIQMEVTNISTGEVLIGNVTPTISRNDGAIIQENKARAAVLKENTFTNYEYTKTYGNPNVWELRRPNSSALKLKYFKTKETSSNSAALNSFKSYVDSINSLEGKIIMAYGTGALSVIVAAAAGAGAIFTGGILTPAAWASIVAVAGVSQSAVNTFMQYDLACKNAYDRYWTVYYSSNVYY